MADALWSFKAEIFQALAHPTRIAIVERLRDGECSAGQLIQALNLEQSNVSQHLAVLRGKRIVHSRKEKNQVLYSLLNPALIEVLDLLRAYFYNHLSHSVTLLSEIQRQQEGEEAPITR